MEASPRSNDYISPKNAHDSKKSPEASGESRFAGLRVGLQKMMPMDWTTGGNGQLLFATRPNPNPSRNLPTSTQGKQALELHIELAPA